MGRHCLALGGLLGHHCVTGLASLDVCELLSRLMIACSRAMTVDCFREISSDEQIFVVLVSGV